MNRLAFSCLLLAACAASPAELDLDLAAADATGAVGTGGKADAGWVDAATLHAGVRVFDRANVNSRRVHAVWLAGNKAAPIVIDVAATAAEGHDVRFAVLGPLVRGKRAVLAADGYASRERSSHASVEIETTGEHLIVVGSYRLESETFYDLELHADAEPGQVDALASPKSGALVGDAQRLVSLQLGDALVSRTFDIEVELWSSPPMQHWNATKVATSSASGNQVNFIVPSSVHDGDDLQLVVRAAGGRTLDSGVLARFSAVSGAFARTDAILYGDLVSLQIAGVVGFFEGVAELVLRSETYKRDIAHDTLHADQPGQVGNGLNAFDATFAPELTDPNVPRNGEKLSVGFINGNGDYSRLSCFEYCNDLSGTDTCTGGPRGC
ncbi:MAG: hypothetical protein WKG01_03610 [Kofleriaceae bacterium]